MVRSRTVENTSLPETAIRATRLPHTGNIEVLASLFTAGLVWNPCRAGINGKKWQSFLMGQVLPAAICKGYKSRRRGAAAHGLLDALGFACLPGGPLVAVPMAAAFMLGEAEALGRAPFPVIFVRDH